LTAAPARRFTRRSALAMAAAMGGGASAAVSPAGASVSNLFLVVDAQGSGDYTSLQAAVAAAPPNTTIFVRRGLYPITAQMEPAAGVRIVGEGYGSHVRAVAGLNTNVFLIRTDNVVFEHLRVDGNGPNQTFAQGSCIDFQPSVGGTVIDCWVEAAAAYNIVAYPGCSHVVFAGNHSYDAREEGIELAGSQHSVVVGNTVKRCLNGINVWSSSADCAHNAVVGNVIEACTSEGIVVQDGAHDCAVVGNTSYRNGGSGILVGAGGGSVPRASYQVAVAGNTASGNSKHGIQLNRVWGCNVSRNVVRANGAHGVLARVVEGCSVTGNIARLNSACGIRVETEPSESSRGVTVTANVSFENGRDGSAPGAGVSVYGAVQNVVVTQNRCFDGQATRTQRRGLDVQDAPSPSPPAGNLLLGPNLLDGNRDGGLAPGSGASAAHVVPHRRVAATVGRAQTAVPHGLPHAPLALQLAMRSAGRVWRSAPADATNVYLTADADGCQVELLVG
jgi:parallel beta-helix repeat protein